MTIKAKFSSKCPNCQQQIAVGESVEWNPGEKARHASCQTVAPEPVQRISVDEVGVYVLRDGSVVKVQANKDKTRTYAMLWTEISGMRLTEDSKYVYAKYQYAPGLIGRVAREGRRMSLDEAKAFILRYGICARCSRMLVAAESVERGIGPVCIKYFSAGTTAADLMAGSQDAEADMRAKEWAEPASILADDSDEVEYVQPVSRYSRRNEYRSRWTRASDDELEHAAGY